jgi:predicted MFS family arabinose efflux permease
MSVPQSVALPRSLVVLFAVGAAFAVATLYASQPILGVLQSELAVNATEIGLVPTLTQLGYALGILLLAPLGDRYDRRRIIVGKSGVLAAALVLAGVAPSVQVLWFASLAIGLSATMAQDIVPAAATLAPEARRGQVVGTVMTGLLLGILVSRVVSGVIAEQLGWRAVFFIAAACIALLGVAMWKRLPSFAPTTDLGYRALLGSLRELWIRHAGLRRAAIAQALLAVGFSAFWSTLAVFLHAPPFALSSAGVGLFGIAGVAGALAARVAGGVADRRGPERVTQLGAALAVIAFGAMAWLPLLGSGPALVLLAVTAIVFDLGTQAALVAHQTIIYSLEPAARSRLNALLVVSMFVGMASGAALGSMLLARWGWMGVTALAAGSALLALVVRLGARGPASG